MQVVISLLRGVNVTGKHMIRMDALRDLCELLGLRNVQTFIQSGNIVFATKERDLARLSKRIAGAIDKNFGFRPEVISRTPSDFRDVIARNPCASMPDMNPAKFLVYFLAADPGDEAREKVRTMGTESEQLWIEGCHLYVYYHNMARPKLKVAAVDRALQTLSTGRNWNSVRKLLELAEQLESQAL